SAEYADQIPAIHPPKLFINNGDLTFTDHTKQANLERSIYAMGLNIGDIDNDSYTDLYIGTGHPDFRALWPNLMLRNNAGKYFEDITASTLTGQLQKGHGIAFADMNNNGCPDIFAQVGGFFSDDEYWDALYENPGNNNNWIRLKLIGEECNKSAIGARIEVTIVENGKERVIYRTVNSGASYGASPLEQHIGIGKATVIKSIAVHWNNNNRKIIFQNIPPNQKLIINELSDTPVYVPVNKISMKKNNSHQHLHHH